MYMFRWLAFTLFVVYVGVFPGSTSVVALDRVPAWGTWMGGALLLLQGAAGLCWLIGFYGRRGAVAGALVFVLAWAVEHVGVTMGFPFGRYAYTDMLQPQLFGVVPLPITFAWLMVAFGAWQIARAVFPPSVRSNASNVLLAATLVLLLDLQIETVATEINRYWVWLDGGSYYGIPTTNFIAWWLVGLAMAFVVERCLSERGARPEEGVRRRRLLAHAWRVPSYLYLLSTLMFAVVNLARGYVLAGLVGAGVLLAGAAWALLPRGRAPKFSVFATDAEAPTAGRARRRTRD